MSLLSSSASLRFSSFRLVLMVIGLAMVAFTGVSINPRLASAQVQIAQADSAEAPSQDAAADAKAPFSQLVVKPIGLPFKPIKFPGSINAETKNVTISNKGTTALKVTVNPPSGLQAADFSVSPAGLFTVTNSTPLTIQVTYRPVMDGKSKATILIGSDATKGHPQQTIQLSGVAKGPIPPTPTATNTPFATATPTATGSAHATPTGSVHATPTGSVHATPTGSPGATSTATMVGTATATSSSKATATATPAGTPTATMAGTATATMVGSATATSTATGSATGTPTASPTATAQPAGMTDKTSANAPGVIITGNTVVAYVPFGNNASNVHGVGQVTIEPSSASAAPVIATDRVNSCTPAKTGTVVCSGQAGDIDLIVNGAVTMIPAGTVTNQYAGGDCAGCGAEVDDMLGSKGTGIISTGNGFTTLDLSAANPAPSAFFGAPYQSGTPSGNEPVGVNFGYDPVNHRILNANYQVTNLSTFASSPPDFQIFDITNPASPVGYDLSNAATFFASSATCGSGTPSTQLPETSAIDTSTQIAYVTFHTPSACFGSPPNDIALFDLTQASFNAGTHLWSTTGEAIQALTGIGLNGIDPISIQSSNHLAIVSGGSTAFGALALPATSGTGNPAIVDWVGANMPNDPNGAAWVGWPTPDGLATYVSPTSSKPMGVMMNVGAGSGPTFLAIVDLQALLNTATTKRDPVNTHHVDSSVDGQALITNGIVKFVRIQ